MNVGAGRHYRECPILAAVSVQEGMQKRHNKQDYKVEHGSGRAFSSLKRFGLKSTFPNFLTSLPLSLVSSVIAGELQRNATL
jgi:hypothetical protein